MIARSAFPDLLELTETEAKLVSLLVLRERVSRQTAYHELYSLRAEKPNVRTLKVYIRHIRVKFERLELRIDTLWGWGWKMPAADRERLKSGARCPMVNRE